MSMVSQESHHERAAGRRAQESVIIQKFKQIREMAAGLELVEDLLLSLCYLCVISVLSLCYLCAISMLSLCYLSVISVLSLCYLRFISIWHLYVISKKRNFLSSFTCFFGRQLAALLREKLLSALFQPPAVCPC